MSHSLEDSLTTFASYLDAALVSRAALDRVRSIAQRLPPVSAFGFESRLGDAAPEVDFGARFLRKDKRSPVGFEESLREVALAIDDGLVWPRLRSFCDRWEDAQDRLHAAAEDVFLEFDLDAPPAPQPVPSFFLEFDKRAPGPLRFEAAVDLLLLLGGKAPAPAFHDHLAVTFGVLPAGAQVTAFGMMLARADRGARVCVTGLSMDALPHYLEAVGWPGNIGEAAAWTARFASLVDRVEPCLDVAERTGPKLGLELQIDGSLRDRRRRWHRVLDALAAAGLCQPSKHDALVRWIGYARAAQSPQDGRAEYLLGREINHIKLVIEPGRAAVAKGYFAFVRYLITPKREAESEGGSEPG